MRVYDVNVTGAGAAESGRTQEAQKSDRGESTKAGATGSSRGSGDRVELSSTLGRLSQAMLAYGSQRANRVQALAAQYSQGTYSPDSAATSHAMVSDALTAVK